MSLWQSEEGPWDDPEWWAPEAREDLPEEEEADEGEDLVDVEMDDDFDVKFDHPEQANDDTSTGTTTMDIFTHTTKPKYKDPNAATLLVKLPDELKLLIIKNLSVQELLLLGTVCRSLLPICNDKALETAVELPHGRPKYMHPILRIAIDRRSTSLLARVRNAITQSRERARFPVDWPIWESSFGNPSKLMTMLEIAVHRRDREMTEWLLINGARADGPGPDTPPALSVFGRFEGPRRRGAAIVQLEPGALVESRADERAKNATPLSEILKQAVDDGKAKRPENFCVQGIVCALLKHGAKVGEPAKVLVQLEKCGLHYPEHDCLLKMAEAFLASVWVQHNMEIKKRVKKWMRDLGREQLLNLWVEDVPDLKHKSHPDASGPDHTDPLPHHKKRRY